MRLTWRRELAHCLPMAAQRALDSLSEADAAHVREIRFRMGCRMEAKTGAERVVLPLLMDERLMDDLIAALCGGAVYAHEESMAQGYIALAGGHRAGICGRLSGNEGAKSRMSSITSVCIRIARPVPGASAGIRSHLLNRQGGVRSVLFLGPPGSGKTTMLRDAGRWLSDDAGKQVAVADERDEMFPGGGAGMDIICGSGKGDMIRRLIRSMAPEVILCDEIGSRDDAHAILDAARSGVSVMASAHAGGIEDAARRPSLSSLIGSKAFERLICLKEPGLPPEVYDASLRGMGDDGAQYGQGDEWDGA